MKSITCALLLVLAWTGRTAAEEGRDVTLDGLKSAAPEGWKAQPAHGMRAYQFLVPKVEGDPNDADVIVFFFGTGGGGGAADNLKRWKGMFVPPEGKSIDDVAHVENFKVGEVPVTYLDVQGTYKYKATPMDPNEELRPDHRMIAIVFDSPKGPYFIRFVGPAKTVSQHKDEFDRWLKAFK